MPKKIKIQRENRGRGGRGADREERGGGWKNSRGRGRPDSPGNPNENQRPYQGDYQQPGPDDYQQPGGQQDSGAPGGAGDLRRILRERRARGGYSPLQGRPARKGCFPKLFVLTMPFALLVAWIVLAF
jgi:hypothetical protein